MQLLGKRLLIKKPERPVSVIELSDEAREALDKEFIKRYTRLEVFEVGSDCTTIKKGDFVYLGTSLEHSEIVEIDETLYFMVNEAQVSIVW
jgi:hypothetical protein